MPSFERRPIEDLSESLDWGPGVETLSGRAANTVVNRALHELDRVFASYMGEPPVPSLLTYAKHASRTVGSQLARMEATLRFLRYFDLNAVADLVRDMRSQPAIRGQALALTGEFLRAPFHFYRTLQVLRRAIQWGNLQAYESLVPAFGIYLERELGGGDGVEALLEAGYGSGAKDPRGLVVRAFRLYRGAYLLGMRNLQEQLGEAGEDLITARRRLAFAATLTLSLHEQMLFQASECYDDPVVRRVLGRLTPTLVIEDPVDTMVLLPDGGNWADFTDRMGLEETSADEELSITDPDGRTRSYRIASTGGTGTIFDYLSSRFLDPEALDGVAGPPLPLPAYDDGEGRAIDRLRQSYHRFRGEYRPGQTGLGAGPPDDPSPDRGG